MKPHFVFWLQFAFVTKDVELIRKLNKEYFGE